MKYVKIHFRNKSQEPVNLSLEKWEGIIKDPNTLVAYKLETETEWTGRVMNKSEIVDAYFDREYTQKMNEPKFTLWRNKKTNVVTKMTEGELPDEIDNYERL